MIAFVITLSGRVGAIVAYVLKYLSLRQMRLAGYPCVQSAVYSIGGTGGIRCVWRFEGQSARWRFYRLRPCSWLFRQTSWSQARRSPRPPAATSAMPAASRGAPLRKLRLQDAPAAEPTAPAKKTYTVPAGTKVLLQLRSAVNTKSAKAGDGVYLASTFPVVVGNRVMIPSGFMCRALSTGCSVPGA